MRFLNNRSYKEFTNLSIIYGTIHTKDKIIKNKLVKKSNPRKQCPNCQKQYNRNGPTDISGRCSECGYIIDEEKNKLIIGLLK